MDGEEIFEIGIKALITNDKKEMLLLRAGKEELRYEKVDFWDLPGGRIQTGYSIKETLLREIKEELGVPAKDVIVNGIVDAGISNFKVHRGKDRLSLMLIAYHCKLKGKKKFKLSDEHSEYRWVKPSEARVLLKRKFPKEFIDRLCSLQ